MLIPLIALAIMPMADTPIEPIDSALFLLLGDEASEAICPSYAELRDLVLELDDSGVLLDAADAYMIASFEDGYDPTGNSRLTSEARDVLLDIMHAC